MTDIEQEARRIGKDPLAIRKGIILAGGTGSRLFPLTQVVSKQLMPVYDKPMIYYLLSVLMLARVRDILVITTPQDAGAFQTQLGDGSLWGVNISYAVQEKPEGLPQAYTIAEEFLEGEPSCLVLGDNLFYGESLSASLETASLRQEGGTVFGYYTSHPEEYGVVEFDESGKVLSLEEKPKEPKSNYAVPGIYFLDGQAPAYTAQLKPSARGELEIMELIGTYLKRDELRVEILGRGTAWLDTGNPDALADATQFVQVIQHRQGLKISCPEEIALRQGRITREQLQLSIQKYAKSAYGQYLAAL
jgi:glucose-1-phosphate thymidylyltransferase